MTRSKPFITNVRVDHGSAQDWVSIEIHGARAGTLMLPPGDGLLLKSMLLAHDEQAHTKEAGLGAPAPSRRRVTRRARAESRPPSVPPAAGAPPTIRRP